MVTTVGNQLAAGSELAERRFDSLRLWVAVALRNRNAAVSGYAGEGKGVAAGFGKARQCCVAESVRLKRLDPRSGQRTAMLIFRSVGPQVAAAGTGRENPALGGCSLRVVARLQR